MKKLFPTIILSVACTLYVQQTVAQNTKRKSSFETYKAQRQKAFEEYKSKKQREFDEYRKKKNEEFAAYIQKKWEAFNGKKPKPKPKDRDIPPVVIKDEQKQKPIENKSLPIKETVTPPKPQPQPTPIAPIQNVPKPEEKWQKFVVYGTDMKVRFTDIQRFRLSDLNESSIADCWKRLSTEKNDNTIYDCIALRDNKKLSDWAYLNMLQKMAEKCFGQSNEATLFVAYVFAQSGYQMRLARTGNKLRLLYASKHAIFGQPYYTIDRTDYYVWNGNETSLQICNVGFPKEKPLSLYVSERQGLTVNPTSSRTLVSKRYPDMKASVSVNKNLIDFYNSYPTSSIHNNFMTRWAMYANTPIDATAKKNLYPALQAAIKGCSEKEAVEKLLNWVQTAFVYEYDDKVWGHDRAFFAEESLYYPYCDCEDRSILLSRLVRDLLGLKVVLVYYPGHLAAAIRFNQDVKGDYIALNGVRYTVCDPTYIGASVGMTMPGMNNGEATIILLD